MGITRLTDHAEQALALLLSQYQDKPRLAALLSSYVRRCQELEDATWDVLTLRLIDDAADEQLDAIGRLVGEVRDGKDDATFRLFILTRIRINLSFGHADDVIDVLNLVETADFILREFYPATMVVEFLAATTRDATVLIGLARRAKSAGVRLQLVYSDHVIGGTAFSFCSGTSAQASTTEGFALSGSTNGGRLAGVLE